MNRRLPLLLLPLLALVVGHGLVDLICPLPASARPAPLAPTGGAADDDPAAVALLERAEAALRGLGWSGSEYVAAWEVTGAFASVVDVTHVPGRGTAARSRGAAVEAAPPQFSADTTASAMLAPGGVDRLVAAYRAVVRGRDEVDGRPAVVVAVERGDGSVAARLWVDPRCGLPLRREVYTDDGVLARSSVLTDVRLRSRGDPATRLTGTAYPVDALDTVDSNDAAAVAGAAGQAATSGDGADVVPSVLAGTLWLADATRLPDGVLHLTYSDGLFSVSVFEQRGRLDVAALDGATPRRMGGSVVRTLAGMPVRLTWQGGDRVFTVVSDAPEDVLDAVVGALPHTDAAAGGDQGGGLPERLWRGAGRVSAWLNPFD